MSRRRPNAEECVRGSVHVGFEGPERGERPTVRREGDPGVILVSELVLVWVVVLVLVLVLVLVVLCRVITAAKVT